jgi:hypothetical protein
VEIKVEGDGDVSILFPLFDFDGKDSTTKEISTYSACVTHKGSTCTYSTDAPITDTGMIFANRNGHYKALSVSDKNSVSLKITID